MKKILTVITVILAVLIPLSAQGLEETVQKETKTILFTDSCGREVEIPETITKAAPSGVVAQLIMYTQCPDILVGWSRDPGASFLDYMDPSFSELPIFGQFYGKNANYNLEEVIKADPQVIIDMGDNKSGIKESLDALQKKIGIPVIFIEANVNTFASAYTTLGSITGTEQHAKKATDFINETLSMAQKNKSEIKNKVSIMFGTGQDGLACNAKGSFHAEVIDIIGAENAISVSNLSGKGGGNIINMEQLYLFNPDIIIQEDSVTMTEQKEWQELDAVKNNRVYKIPDLPQSWMADPPSVNKILGIWWLGQIAYPDLYSDYDIVEKAQEYYSIFYHHETTREEMEDILGK